MALTSTNVQNFLDSITKTILDLQNAFNTTLSSDASTITAGQSTLLSKLASINDIPTELALGSQLTADTNGVTGSVSKTNNAIYAMFAGTLNLLDQSIGGLNAYLTANSVLVHPELANAFAYMVGTKVRNGITSIAASNVFVATEQTLATIAVTGAAAGTFGAGTPLDTTKYASQQLYLKNTAGGGTVGTATSFTITYTNAAGTAGQTVTQALSGSLAAGAYLAAGAAVGQAVSNIVVNSGGSNGDTLAVVIKVLRTPTY